MHSNHHSFGSVTETRVAKKTGNVYCFLIVLESDVSHSQLKTRPVQHNTNFCRFSIEAVLALCWTVKLSSIWTTNGLFTSHLIYNLWEKWNETAILLHHRLQELERTLDSLSSGGNAPCGGNSGSWSGRSGPWNGGGALPHQSCSAHCPYVRATKGQSILLFRLLPKSRGVVLTLLVGNYACFKVCLPGVAVPSQSLLSFLLPYTLIHTHTRTHTCQHRLVI